MPVQAFKDSGSDKMERTFSDHVWKTGVPQKNGWKQLDYNTEVIAAKLPEQMEVKVKRTVEKVEAPVLPQVEADEEVADSAIDPVEKVVEKKRGPKKKVDA